MAQQGNKMESSLPIDLNNKNVGRSCSPPSKIQGLQQFQHTPSPNGTTSSKDSNPSQVANSAKITSPLKKIANTASQRKQKLMSNLIKRPPVKIEYDTL